MQPPRSEYDDLNIPYHPTTSGPFGNPDATKASADDEFIDIDGIIPSPLHDTAAMSRRVIVGRKGSGKSLYLRWHRLTASRRDIMILSESANISTFIIGSIDSVASREAAFVSRKTEGRYVNITSYVTNFWSQVWERSLYLCIASIALSSDALEQGERNRATSAYEHLFFGRVLKEGTPVGMLQLMNSELSDGEGSAASAWRRYLDHPDWSSLRSDLTRWCRRLPPIALYIDAIDDDFEDAPQMWLHCQGGLFKTAFEALYRDERLSGRVHLVIAIRDVAYSGIIQSEHRTRFATHGRIEHLNWNKQTIRAFLHEKIRRIPNELAVNRRVDASVEPFIYWLGFNEVENKRRRKVERVSDYIIRHTRMLPRDIVIMGNAISERMDRRRSEGKKISDAPLRQQVADMAKYIATEAIQLCAIELTMSAEFMKEVLLQDWSKDVEGLKAIEMIREIVGEKVRDFFKCIGREVFSREDLDEALSIAGLASPGLISSERQFFRFDNILWRHGMLATYVTEGSQQRWRFRWRGILEEATIDREAAVFGFHSSLIDLYGLQTCPEGPVF